MIEFLTIPFDIFNLARFIFTAAKFWRLTCSLLAASIAIAVLCLLWDSPGVRWITGFHLVIVFLTFGLLWEYNDGQLKYA